MAQAAGWLTFLNRLQIPPKPVTVYDQMLAEFRSFMKEDRGLSPATVKGCCSSVRPFLIQLLEGRRSLEKITVSDVDLLLAQKVNEEHYARRSVRDYASSLRSFFWYAEMRGWVPGRYRRFDHGTSRVPARDPSLRTDLGCCARNRRRHRRERSKNGKMTSRSRYLESRKSMAWPELVARKPSPCITNGLKPWPCAHLQLSLSIQRPILPKLCCPCLRHS